MALEEKMIINGGIQGYLFPSERLDFGIFNLYFNRDSDNHKQHQLPLDIAFSSMAILIESAFKYTSKKEGKKRKGKSSERKKIF